jgi:hypothetical protein
MSAAVSTRTICCKVALDSVADAALRATQAAFNQAATYCASVAWTQGVTNKNKLHHCCFSLPFDMLRTNGSMVLSSFVGYFSPRRAKNNLQDK